MSVFLGLIKKIYEIDRVVCPRCGAEMKILADCFLMQWLLGSFEK